MTSTMLARNFRKQGFDYYRKKISKNINRKYSNPAPLSIFTAEESEMRSHGESRPYMKLYIC